MSACVGVGCFLGDLGADGFSCGEGVVGGVGAGAQELVDQGCGEGVVGAGFGAGILQGECLVEGWGASTAVGFAGGGADEAEVDEGVEVFAQGVGVVASEGG